MGSLAKVTHLYQSHALSHLLALNSGYYYPNSPPPTNLNIGRSPTSNHWLKGIVFVGFCPQDIQEQDLIPLKKAAGLLGTNEVSKEGDLAATPNIFKVLYFLRKISTKSIFYVNSLVEDCYYSFLCSLVFF